MEFTQKEKDKLITLFVSFYGEQHREYITRKINETEFIIVSSLRQKKNIRSLAEEELKKQKESVAQEMASRLNIDPKLFVCIDNNDLLNEKLYFPDDKQIQLIRTLGFEINQIYKNYKATFNAEERERFIEIFNAIKKAFDTKLAPAVQEKEKKLAPYNEALEKIDKIQAQKNQAIEEAKEEKVKSFYTELQKRYPQFQNIELDYDLKYKITKVLNACSNLDFLISDVLDVFDTIGLHFETLDEFKESGISQLMLEHGLDKVISKIEEEYNKKLREADVLYQESIKKFLSIKGAKQESFTSLMEDLECLLSSTGDAQAFMTSYLTEDNQTKEVVVLTEDFNDHQLIHELNHALESHFVKATEDGFYTISGFDEYKTSFNPTEDIQTSDKGRRKYEYFNEAVNEAITLKIMAKGKELGIKITQDSTSQDSGYSLGIALAIRFIKSYLKELTECRLSDNPMQFKEVIGEENFEQIARSLDVIMSCGSIRIFGIVKGLEEKTGKTYEGLYDFAMHADEMLQLDLSKTERKIVESAQAYITTTEGLIASKQETLKT